MPEFFVERCGVEHVFNDNSAATCVLRNETWTGSQVSAGNFLFDGPQSTSDLLEYENVTLPPVGPW
jgi:hypothetical protein